MTDFSFIDRITPRYRTQPATATGTNFYRESLGVARVQDASIPLNRGRFDMRRSARWHSLRIDQAGAATINGLDVSLGGDTPE